MRVSRSSVALGAALFLLSLLAQAPPAGAAGAGVCTISGTITFSPTPQTPTQGGWTIEPAVIDCYGVFRGDPDPYPAVWNRYGSLPVDDIIEGPRLAS